MVAYSLFQYRFANISGKQSVSKYDRNVKTGKAELIKEFVIPNSFRLASK
jgi:hypothetical protein